MGPKPSLVTTRVLPPGKVMFGSADAVCIHGSTAREFAPALDAYAKLREGA